VLEDGRVFRGKGIGARVERAGEVVFNTGLTGYQEIFTDPSYSGQIVVLTYPQIGNYGVNVEDRESLKPYLEGLVVREFSQIASNRRSQQTADEYLAQAGVPIIGDLDTRALVRHLRDQGAMRGVISSIDLDPRSLRDKARAIPTMAGLDLASTVSTKERYEWTEPVPASSPSEHIETADEKFHVVAYDFGIKHNILRKLRGIGARTTVVPAGTTNRRCGRRRWRKLGRGNPVLVIGQACLSKRAGHAACDQGRMLAMPVANPVGKIRDQCHQKHTTNCFLYFHTTIRVKRPDG
jgi:carbamoyl-phosphate synthase small subunit